MQIASVTAINMNLYSRIYINPDIINKVTNPTDMGGSKMLLLPIKNMVDQGRRNSMVATSFPWFVVKLFLQANVGLIDEYTTLYKF